MSTKYITLPSDELTSYSMLMSAIGGIYNKNPKRGAPVLAHLDGSKLWVCTSRYLFPP